jgi:hypothetical protein
LGTSRTIGRTIHETSLCGPSSQCRGLKFKPGTSFIRRLSAITKPQNLCRKLHRNKLHNSCLPFVNRHELSRLVASQQELILKQCFTRVKRPLEEGSVYRKACISSKSYRCASFQVFAAVQLSFQPFWVMTPCHKVISSRKHRLLKTRTSRRIETSRTDYEMMRLGTPEEGIPPSFFLTCLYLLLTAFIKGHEPLDFAQNK